MEKENLLKKWLNGTLTEEETSAFQELDDYALYKSIVEDAAHFRASELSTVTDFKLLQDKLPKKKTTRNNLKINPWYLRIASVFVIGVSVYFMFFLNATTTIATAVGEKITIVLPDASTVNLNAASEMSYVKKEWDNKRSLHLTGEAFFDVTKGATFDVITPSGTVTVLGTEFNVKQRGAAFEVVCYEGSVRVATGPYSEVLNEGDRLRLTDGKLYVGKTTYRNPQWTGNVSDFQQIPFLEVIEELERQYQIKVLREGVPVDTLFTGGFVHDSLENALRSIAEPMDLNFTIDNNTVTLSHREK